MPDAGSAEKPPSPKKPPEEAPEAAEEAVSQQPEAEAAAKKAKQLWTNANRAFQKGVTSDKVLHDISEAISLVPDEAQYEEEKAQYYFLRSKIYLKMKQMDAALSDANDAIFYNSYRAKYYFHRCVILYELSRYSEARLDKSKAIELDPTKALYYESLAVTFERLGLSRAAVADWMTAERLLDAKQQN